ncbi:hypothetical protein G7072_14995 [Nocardioides sp. HDW12B]|uniref:hypothetical protein n=1 Tax=Nocardioides sp. HDW12B TaxID=2714939 RepID=UPI00140986B0|nr:hypothetical protein [Nocardioides sp. HDW12B]QIK67477.1 hypothetical protein G7072_14995 [Nocardioides sp. HDW12B]
MPRPRHRLTPSLLLVVAALVLASGGVGYAAGQITSSDIKDDTVQSRDIRDGTIAGRDVAPGSIPRDRLNTRCATGESKAFGGCVRRVATGPTSHQSAVDDCNRRGGRLPTIAELRWIATHDEYTWADGNLSQYEFSGDFTTEYPHTPIALDSFGFSVTNASGQLFWHHCVTS